MRQNQRWNVRMEPAMSRRLAPLSPLISLFAVALTVQSCAKPGPAPQSAARVATPDDAVALTFGRCNPGANACPRAPEPEAVGDPEFHAEMLKCFGKQLGHPVYALGNAPIPIGYWL